MIWAISDIGAFPVRFGPHLGGSGWKIQTQAASWQPHAAAAVQNPKCRRDSTPSVLPDISPATGEVGGFVVGASPAAPAIGESLRDI
ncbi:hypothetical protein [Mesorhizobium sp. B4-1-3]|uniref:hypothetical protein n=1 Tax=Mesorhizobium sp. B4-1-3 TaxID=2589889 RepID=UPI0015E40DC9|nr:hypothetical protein [Mesorhizobium sp. B4-1-3]